jgi:hypothetical protein
MSVSAIPLGVTSTSVVGWVLDALFLASLVFVPPPRRLRELAIVVLATLSTMVVFAVERGNPDVLLFMLVLGIGFLALHGPPPRLLAYLITLLAAAVKYYPIILMILSVRERIGRFVAVNFGALSLCVVFVAVYYSDLARGIPQIASGSYFLDFFSARNLPLGIAEALRNPTDGPQSVIPLLGPVSGPIFVVLIASCAAICWRLLRTGHLHSALLELSGEEHIFLAVGSALMVGCFFAGQNLGYRGIFLLLVIPGVLALWRGAAERSVRALGAVTCGVVLFLMWGECFRQNLAIARTIPNAPQSEILAALVIFWYVRELAWWWSVSVMAAIVLDFVWWSETARFVSFALRRQTTRLREN